MLNNCYLSGVARQVGVGHVVDGPEPEQAVVGAVWPVNCLVDVILNVTSDDGMETLMVSAGAGGHLKVSGAVSAAEQEGDVGHHGPGHSADAAHTPGGVLESLIVRRG